MAPHRSLEVWRPLMVGLLLAGGLIFVAQPLPAFGDALDPSPSGRVDPLPDLPIRSPGEEIPHTLYLPLLGRGVALGTRIGYAVEDLNSLRHYADGKPDSFGVASMKAGWYLAWRALEAPPRPDGMEFVQMVRVHQDLTCPLDDPLAYDRTRCPYREPYSYTYWPDAATLRRIARANPGALWLLGNEIDRRDWPGGRQDEILPEVYAEAYHELYTLIKGADPTARIAIGGVVQITPLRLRYLDRVWDAYRARYGERMPVDVWNMHIFILPEKRYSWGADIPVGIEDVDTGAYLFRPDAEGNPTVPMPEHMEMRYIDEQVRLFRSWLKAKGEQEKPVVVTEYGVLLLNWMMGLPEDDPQPVLDFMLATFDYFLNTRDCSLGYLWDDCRLVQRWAWYGLDFTSRFNEYGRLLGPASTELSPAGKVFRDWVAGNLAALTRRPYP